MSRSILPPRRKNWKRGTYQLGIFIRTRDGGTIETVMDARSEVSEQEIDVAIELLKRTYRTPRKQTIEVFTPFSVDVMDHDGRRAILASSTAGQRPLYLCACGRVARERELGQACPILKEKVPNRIIIGYEQ